MKIRSMQTNQNSDLARFTVSMPKALADRIEDYWHDSKSRSLSEAVRKLVEAGLQAQQQRKGGRG